MANERLESYSSAFPEVVLQGVGLRRHVKQHGDWIADGNPYSETTHRYRSLLQAIKNVNYLARLEPDTYHPHIVRDEDGKVAGTATIHTGVGVQHPRMPHPTTGADIDYLLTEKASDEQHLTTVCALLGATGSIALRDALTAKQKESTEGSGIVDWDEVRSMQGNATAFAVVPTKYADNRLRGFELASEAGYMERVEGPAGLSVPKEYIHPFIDFAKGGQQVQLYYAAEIPTPQI